MALPLTHDAVEWLHPDEEWPLLEALCSQHQLIGMPSAMAGSLPPCWHARRSW